MDKRPLKLWLVKKEVLAKSLEEALKKKDGRVYEIQEAASEYQPEKKLNRIGFIKK